MENEVQVVEEVADVSNGNLMKAGIIVLGVGAIIGIGFGIKKLLDKKKVITLSKPEEVEQVPNEQA